MPINLRGIIVIQNILTNKSNFVNYIIQTLYALDWHSTITVSISLKPYK